MDDAERDRLPLPIEVIFSCAVCQATISEIYGQTGSDTRARNTAQPDQALAITRLWLTECSHLTCSEHLEGGGVPFHAAGERPRAACPICLAEREDREKKKLFGIRGCLEGSYHPDIPKNWFDTPPTNLEGPGEGMGALRFHYISLIRFATHTLVKYRKEAAALKEARKKAAEDDPVRRSLGEELDASKRRTRELEHCEKELKPWRDREHKIKHYLGVFTEVTRENEKLREQLTAMGYAVPVRTYKLTDVAGTVAGPQQAPLHPSHSSLEPRERTSPSEFVPEADDVHLRNQTGSSRTLSGRAEPVLNLHTDPALSRTSQKRKVAEDETNEANDREERHRQTRIDDGAFIRPQPTLGQGRSAKNTTSDQRHDRETGLLRLTAFEPRLGEASRAFDPREHTFPHKPGHPSLPITNREGRNHVPDQTTDVRVTVDRGPAQWTERRGSHQPISDGFRDHSMSWADGNDQHNHSDGRWTNAQDGPEDFTSGYANGFGPYETHMRNELAGMSGHSNTFAGRQPLQEQTQADMNTPRPDTRTLSASHAGIYQHKDYNTIDRRSLSSPIRHTYRAPRIPSPQKHPFDSLASSVASPFFNKSNAADHRGRITLPSRTRIRKSLEQVDHTIVSYGERDQNSFLMPPPPKPAVRKPAAPSAFNGQFYNATPTLHPQTNSAFAVPPVTPLIAGFFAPSTPRNAQGLFQRPDTVQQPPLYNNTASEIPPSSPYFHGPNLLTSPMRHPHPQTQTRTIPSTLPSTPSVFHVPTHASQRSTSPTRGPNGFGHVGNTQNPAATYSYHPSRDGRRSSAAWQALSGSRSGVSRLSNEAGRHPGGFDMGGAGMGMGMGMGLGMVGAAGGRRSVRR